MIKAGFLLRIVIVLTTITLLLYGCVPAYETETPAEKGEYEGFTVFANADFDYQIMYPDSWEYAIKSPCKVIFASSMEGLDEHDAQVCLEVINYENIGCGCSDCESVCEAISEYMESIGGRVYDIQECHCECEGESLAGIELKVEYMEDDNPIKKWIAIFPYSEDMFMQFSYSADFTQYSAYMAQARLMRESWEIRK